MSACNVLLAFIVVLTGFYPYRRLLNGEIEQNIVQEPHGRQFYDFARLYDGNFSPSLMSLKELFKHDETEVKKARAKTTWRPVNKLAITMTVLLLLAGDVSPNPGP